MMLVIFSHAYFLLVYCLWGNMSSYLLPIFLVGLFVLLLSLESCLYIMDTNPLSDMRFFRQTKNLKLFLMINLFTINCKIQRYNVQASGLVKFSFSPSSHIFTLRLAVLTLSRP